MCNGGRRTWIFVQKPDDGSWERVVMRGSHRAYNWRNARLRDFNGDGLDDLAVVGSFEKTQTHYLRVFAGTGMSPPYFDFEHKTGVIFERRLAYKVPM
jgi:hypothetical protein